MATKAECLVLDSRKFLGTINNSAQSRVALYESLIARLGQKVGAKWQLAALNEGNLFIEDTTSGSYYVADHQHLRGGKVNITNVRPVKIVEGQKRSLFEQNCRGLVNAIEANDQRAMRTTFNNLAAQKFSPHTIPTSGVVRTRDGVVRKLRVESVSKGWTGQQKQKLVKALVESVSDSVVLESGRLISATFNGDRQKKLPVSEWTCRKVVGTHMRESAKEAYKSEGFQKRIYKVAKLIYSDKIAEAVAGVKDFLFEQQEFCLLTRRECHTLVENTLAARAVMNQQLCNDTATLIYRTNLKVNRDTIVKEWRATAVKSQHPTLLENVSVLEKTKDFDADYDKFLNMTFNEALSPRDEEVKAYRTALGLLRDSPKIQEDVELQEKVNELIDKLSESEVDDATVYLVRETLASAHKELEAMDTLNDYDTQGGSETNAGIDAGEGLGEEIGDDLGDVSTTGAEGQPNIVINSPLIQIGGTSSAAPEGEGLSGEGFGGEADEFEDLGDDLDLNDEEEGEEDLDELGLGGEEEEELGLGGEEEDKDVNINLDSKQKTDKPVSERLVRKALGLAEDKEWLKNKIAEKEGKEGDEEECEEECETECDESSDPYAMGESVDFTSSMGSDYGKSILRGEMNDVVSSMFKIAESKSVDIEDIDTNKLALEAIAASGLRIPEHRINATIDNIVEQFRQIAEDQYKSGTLMRRRNPRRSSLNKTERKKPSGNSVAELGDGAPPEADAGITGEGPKNESRIRRNIVWLEHDENGKGMKGDLDGVRFILDYAEPFVILSEDGNVNVPIPEELFESTLAAAGIKDGDSKPFSKWLAEGIEQFRPITEEEDRVLDEAVATITAGSDGSVSVSVDTGAEGENQPIDLELDGVPGIGEINDADDDDEENTMQPVTEPGIEPEIEAPEDTADEMPNFEADTTPEPEETEEVEEGDEKIQEDKDITDPKKSDYDTTKQDHREPPKEKGAQKPHGKGKKLEGFEDGGGVDVSTKSAPALKSVQSGENRI
jgi:hypothetical protein